MGLVVLFVGVLVGLVVLEELVYYVVVFDGFV